MGAVDGDIVLMTLPTYCRMQEIFGKIPLITSNGGARIRQGYAKGKKTNMPHHRLLSYYGQTCECEGYIFNGG